MKPRHLYGTKAPAGNRLKGILLPFLILATLLITVGCSHQLTVKNIDKYQNVEINSLNKPLTIGIVGNYSKPDGQNLLDGIAASLESYSAKVIKPYTLNSQSEADVVATIAVRSSYEGSSANFWINFPGFLLWAPAWNGYIYEVNHVIDVKLANAGGGQFEKFSIPIELDVRHADINRTWTEISWFEFGIIAFVSGFAFMNYDEKVTPLLATAIQKPVGNYVSQQIIKRINDHLNVIKASSASPPI